jgi:tetratricopeptide (TPR) repeat protein
MKLKNKLRNAFYLSLAILNLAPAVIHAQQLTMPETSQMATVKQRIGLTDIEIVYHSPLAKGRTIWGDVVPYGEVWRAGANENTTIYFSSDVKIEGKALPAGIYGLHMIPTTGTWTVIFSKNSTSWGSYFYKDSEDALRVTVKTNVSENQDWLSYQFTALQPTSAVATLRWEKLTVAFKIEVNVKEMVYESMSLELRGVNGFSAESFLQASRYCSNNSMHLDQAMAWINQSIEIQETFGNLNQKSKLLALQGQTASADSLSKKALSIANEAQLNQYGYDLIGQKKIKEAVTIFQLNVKKYPASWNAYDSLAESYALDGNKKDALKNYKIALSKAPKAQHKRIEDAIKSLEG